MSDEGSRQYFNPVPPTQSTTVGVGVTRLATAVTAAEIDLAPVTNPGLFHRRVSFVVEGTDAVWIAFSAAAGTAVDKSATPGATLAAGTLAANGLKLPGGSTTVFRLDPVNQRYLHIQADANTPVLAIYPSSQRRATDQLPP